MLANCEGKIISEGTNIQLNEAWTNFRFIVVTYRFGLTGVAYESIFYPYSITLNRYSLVAEAYRDGLVLTYLYFDSANRTINVIGNVGGGVYIDYIIGIR